MIKYSELKKSKFDLYDLVILKQGSSDNELKKNTRCIIESVMETEKGFAYMISLLKDLGDEDLNDSFFIPQYEVLEEEIERINK